MDYPIAADDRTAKDRYTSEEKKAFDRSQIDIYNEIRCAAEAHRQVLLDHIKKTPLNFNCGVGLHDCSINLIVLNYICANVD